jgi:dCMP deaminase
MESNSLKRSRPEREEHFFNRAKTAAERSTCLRRRIGAVIINPDGVELSSGYVGSPRKTAHCIEIGKCLRTELRIPAGQRYELCRSVHAEQNAIINAARIGISIFGGEMYIYSERIKGAYPDEQNVKEKIYGPCIICKKEILNVGLSKVHMKEEGVGEQIYDRDQIVLLLKEEEEEEKQKVLPVIPK